jgi:hypothetical protein
MWPENDDYYGSGLYIQKSKGKYGPVEFKKIFKKEVWFLCKDRQTKFYLESIIVNEELLKDNLCMNIFPGGAGGSQKGRILSDQTKRKMSENNIKYWKNKHLSEETKQKLSKKMKGRSGPNKNKHLSEETKQKLSKLRKGKIPWNKGLTKETDERIKKYGESKKGIKFSLEHKQNISKNHADVSGENNPNWKGGISQNKISLQK